MSGWASLWECRAAQSRQARSEDAQGGSWRSAKGGGLTMLGHGSYNDCSCVTEHDVERDLAADGERGEVGGQHENHQFALEPEPHAMGPVRESGHKAQERGWQVAQPGVPHGTNGTPARPRLVRAYVQQWPLGASCPVLLVLTLQHAGSWHMCMHMHMHMHMRMHMHMHMHICTCMAYRCWPSRASPAC